MGHRDEYPKSGTVPPKSGWLTPMKITVVEFIKAVGLWTEESLLKRLHRASCFSVMVNECTDVITVEELPIFCRWVEDGIPVEHFLERVPLKSADAKTIYSTFAEFLKKKIYRSASLWVWDSMEQQLSCGNTKEFRAY